MIGTQVFWLCLSVVLFVILAAVIRHAIFSNDTMSVDAEWWDWIDDRIVIMAPVISFVIMAPLYFWIDSSCTGYMRPGVEKVYEDFRHSPEHWELKRERWIRTTDGLRFSEQARWMAPGGKASFELKHTERLFFLLGISQRARDADLQRYREFEDGTKVEELIKK